MTEQYLCQSYYDDDRSLKDCTCGKCEAVEDRSYKCDCGNNKVAEYSVCSECM